MAPTIGELIVWLVVGALAGSATGMLVKRQREGFGRLGNLFRLNVHRDGGDFGEQPCAAHVATGAATEVEQSGLRLRPEQVEVDGQHPVFPCSAMAAR